MLNTLLVFCEERYLELPVNKDFRLNQKGEPDADGTIEVRWNNNQGTAGGISLIPFQKCKCQGISFLLFTDNPNSFSTVNITTLQIGSEGQKHILVEEPVDIAISQTQLEVMRGCIYQNGRCLKRGNYTIEYGDCLLIGSMKLTWNKGFVTLSGAGYISNLNLAVTVPEASEEYPIYKRSPRIIKRQPEDTVEIAAPKQKEKRKKGQLVKIILPPLLMMCITIAVSLLMKRGLFILISAAGTMMSLVFSVTTYFSDKKEQKEKEHDRIQSYNAYLLQQRKRLCELYNRQKESMEFHYPSVKRIETMIEGFSDRLYEHAANDSDFLCLSLGYASVPSSYRLKYKNDSLDTEKDELTDEMKAVASGFASIPNMPLVIDLKKAHLGIVGEKKYVHEELKALIAELCFAQSYHDIEIVMLVEEEDASEFNWIKWYPHCKVKSINISGLISGENQRDQVLGNITQILKARKQKKEEEKKDSIYLPHYVFIIDNSKLVVNHSIMEYLQGDQSGLGFSMIFTSNIQANLPENIKTILLLNGKNSGTLLTNEGVLVHQRLKTHQVDDIDLERMARRLAPVIHNKGVTTQIPESITFFEMYNVKKPEEIPILQLWKKNASHKSLAVPLGVRAKDDYVYLNLHEKAHGPHGLVAGTTGSGKSEILQSYILSLAVNFHPYEVGFLLIDYKGGGMANLFQNLPHLLGTITNLDGSESMRALASIKSELARRQRIFNENGVNNINQYTKMFKAGEAKQPLPHLFLISDEFAELKKEQPDFMSELVSAARIGRSLGVHLILATQKPTGVVDDQIWSNSKFKLALKVQDEADSKEVLKTPDAARITQPGRAYLQVGNNEIYELFQSAWSGAAYSDKMVERGFDNRLYLINALGQGELLNQDLSGTETQEESKLTQLDVVVSRINEIYHGMKTMPIEKPWLPPLGDQIVTTHLDKLEMQSEECMLTVSLGIVDIPEEQSQVEYIHNFLEDGNLAVFGASGFGKSTLEMNAALTLAAHNSSAMLHYYVLDYGNSSLIQLRGLPHTADYLTFDDSEKLKKLMKFFLEEMRRRKQLFAKVNAMNFSMYNSIVEEKIPAIILLIDNYDVVKEIGMELEEFLTKLTRDGVGIGIYTVITASRSNAVRYAVLNNFKNKIAQFMYDPTEISAIVGRSSYKLPEKKGRALVKQKNVSVMQCYLPVAHENDRAYVAAIDAKIQEIKAQNQAPQAEGIPMLPEILRFDAFAKVAKYITKKAAVGVDSEDVAVQYLDLNTPNHLIVGTAQTGKSNMLKLIYHMCPDAQTVFVADSSACELQDLEQNENVVYCNNETQMQEFAGAFKTCIESRIEQYKQSGRGVRPRDFYAKLPAALLLIDDGDRFVELCKPIAMDMEKLILQAGECGICIITATQPTKLRGYDNISKKLKDAQTGIILGNPAEQTLLVMQPMRGYRQQVDMGFLYFRGSAKQIKIPLVPQEKK